MRPWGSRGQGAAGGSRAPRPKRSIGQVLLGLPAGCWSLLIVYLFWIPLFAIVYHHVEGCAALSAAPAHTRANLPADVIGLPVRARRWPFWEGFVFVATVVSTIGSGNTVPVRERERKRAPLSAPVDRRPAQLTPCGARAKRLAPLLITPCPRGYLTIPDLSFPYLPSSLR